MTEEAIEDRIQAISRAVTQKIEASVKPDEQTIRIAKREGADPLPRAELIRLVTQNYEQRRGLTKN